MKEKKEKYEGMGTKVSPAMAVVINAICDTLGVDVYHLLQQFLYTLVRAASSQHELSPEIQKIMTLMESDAGWQNAFNLCNPDGLKVAQCILILEQQDKRGFGAVMIDSPWMGKSMQTECVDDILERVTEVTMHGIYKRLRRLGARMDCQHLSDILLTMIDAQTILELEHEDQEAMTPPANIAENGRAYGYGKKTKGKQRRTIDGEANRQQRIHFGQEDIEAADMEVEPDAAASGTGATDLLEFVDNGRDVEQALGCRPFTEEA